MRSISNISQWAPNSPLHEIFELIRRYEPLEAQTLEVLIHL